MVGSPTGSNVFRVVGGGGTASTDLFTVAGKLAGPPVPVFNGPASADFGSTPNGLGVVRTVTVTSFGLPDAGGASNLTFGPIGISGPQAAAFALVGDTCTGRVLPSGLQCQLTVRFAPGAARPAAASLDIAHNASGGASHVALGGTGIAPAAAPGPAPAAAAAPAPAPRAAVAGTSAAGKLAIAKLQTTHRLSRARALRRALRLTMRLPRDTEIVRIAVFRVRGGKADRTPIWVGYRVPSHAGLYRLRLDSRTLRRRLKAGVYQVNVRPGTSKRALGRTITTRIRVTR